MLVSELELPFFGIEITPFAPAQLSARYLIREIASWIQSPRRSPAVEDPEHIVPTLAPSEADGAHIRARGDACLLCGSFSTMSRTYSRAWYSTLCQHWHQVPTARASDF